MRGPFRALGRHRGVAQVRDGTIPFEEHLLAFLDSIAVEHEPFLALAERLQPGEGGEYGDGPDYD